MDPGEHLLEMIPEIDIGGAITDLPTIKAVSAQIQACADTVAGRKDLCTQAITVGGEYRIAHCGGCCHLRRDEITGSGDLCQNQETLSVDLRLSKKAMEETGEESTPSGVSAGARASARPVSSKVELVLKDGPSGASVPWVICGVSDLCREEGRTCMEG